VVDDVAEVEEERGRAWPGLLDVGGHRIGDARLVLDRLRALEVVDLRRAGVIDGVER
jgi:hypothetical protein